jgi:hypothetical protein
VNGTYMICLLFSRARICKRLRRPGIDSGCPCLAGRYVKQDWRTGPPSWESIPGLLKRFTNSGSELGKYGSSCQLPCLCLCDLVCAWRTVYFRKHDKSLRGLTQLKQNITLPPSTKENPWEKHKGHHSPSL